eukprot:scpid110591/ scgid33677/ 
MGQTASKEQLIDLLSDELRLGVGCVGECNEKENTVLCLVEQRWLAGVSSLGLVSTPVYDGDQTSTPWLQAAVHEHEALITGWQRVAIRVIVKPNSGETGHDVGRAPVAAARVLVPPCNPQLTSSVVVMSE